MSTQKTFRLWLEPDRDFPQFQRLRWELVEVPIRDVLMDGIHPWTESADGADKHPSLIEAFLERLNEDDSKVTALDSLSYCYDISTAYRDYRDKKSRFEHTLELVHKDVYFVDDLAYLKLLDIAKRRLQDAWSHSTARALAEGVHPGFQELRRFLKSKDKTIKLSGYEDIDQYDLGEILSLDDFEGADRLIVSHAIPSLNFRKASFLGRVTDARGRLRVVPEIKKVTMTEIPGPPDYAHVLWHVERHGEVCRFRPDTGRSESKRAKAREFAEQWRVGDGRLCFQTSMDKLVQIVEERAAVPSFPTLSYTHEPYGPTATADVQPRRVEAFHIGGFCNCGTRTEDLKEILREYGVSMTGNKGKLLDKLARLAAHQYEEQLSELDGFFSEHRFVRVDATLLKTTDLPILDNNGVPYLRNMLLAMYALKHLRGNAILEPSHENNTYTTEELALALLNRKVSLGGVFLPVM